MQTEVRVLKAEHGDAILVKTQNFSGENFTILIDGGTSKTYTNVLKKELQSIQVIDLMVLTHIDADHIKGLIKFIESELFDKKEVKEYWFNSKNINFLTNGDNISYGQAITLEKLLLEKTGQVSKWNKTVVAGMKITLDEGITAEIISPTVEILKVLDEKWPELPDEYNQQVEDISIGASSFSQMNKGSLFNLAKAPFKPDKSTNRDIFNSSSIAFVLRTPDIGLLLLGDARPEIYIEGLKAQGYNVDNKLKVDYVKVSHHGSMNNTTVELADLVECENYVISTNGGMSGHRLPDRETIARIIYNPERVNKGFANERTVYFNYPLPDIEAKAGKFLDDKDFENGNWRMIDNTNSFKN